MRKLAMGAAAAAAAGFLSGGAALVGGQTGAAAAPAASYTRPGQAAGATSALRAHRRTAGIHGQATFRAKGGAFVVRTWQRGTVTARTAATVTVRSADGLSWTWSTGASTRVRRDGGRSALSAVAVGDDATVVGTPASSPSGYPAATAVVVRNRTAQGN
ncbi:hypothetical protein [Microbispora sp. ATCC PTA-5024]|uniref:hypothetical protein n=1 Tax=Microbispora sp. ATCC PTA-5024 TaxID=316330 RepID=UPI0003DD2AF3|nr:hypothetical protein [Microbispora sp. ATCC PTA-5024]ETK33090.1 hypothetical protein MPTA5024_26175 [Microbispora sp. ATCC PTA-5024]